MKYKEWLYEWLSNYVKPTSKEKTYIRYYEISEQHIMPQLGAYELSDLTPFLVQKFVTDLTEKGNLRTGKGLSANSVNLIISVIQLSVRTAFTVGYLPNYEMDKIKRPKIKEKKVDCFTVAEQKKIEQAVMTDKRPKMFGVVLCFYTGLRIGELLALEWSDIDFSVSELNVTKSCHDGKYKNGVSEKVIDAPKTESSVRTIPIPKPIMVHLKALKKQSESRYVIASGENGVSVRSYQASFSLLLKRLNIPHKGFHATRHTFATRALECGMDVKTLSEILGHNDPTVTLKRYAHSMMEHKKDMMNRVGKLL